ncbi:MAG: hypothetical protein OXU51_11490 [Candidatus Poribacteria bacterium]|nr:hypothetical protein [Candidatus Poribacteria bacterium]
MATKHDKTAQRIAQKEGTSYNKGQGPDIKTSRQVTEVETIDTISDAARQLQGYQRPVYVAGEDDAATQAALEYYRDTTIGVKDPSGNILKSSSRKRAQ